MKVKTVKVTMKMMEEKTRKQSWQNLLRILKGNLFAILRDRQVPVQHQIC